MSEFFRNLVGRSLGVLEVVQPRVPALYEPYRRDSGLLSARPGLQVRDAGSEPMVETSSDSAANAVPNQHQTQRLRTRAADPAAHEGQSADGEPEVEPAEAVELSHPSQPARPAPPSLTPAVRPGPIAAIQIPGRARTANDSDASPIAPPASLQPILTAVKARPDGARLITTQAGDTGGARPEVIRPFTESEVAPAPGPVPGPMPRLVRHPRTPDVKTEPSSQRADLGQAVAPRAAVTPSLVAHQVQLDTSAVRPPVAPRSGGTRSPGTLPPSSPPQPSVQVSIGRVEVRAIFPEPPAVRRAPAPRSRPTVSLDDYLNQRNEGQG